MNAELKVAVVGCGLGGATVAALLQRQGFEVRVYEQAASFAPLGAGIHVTPNAMKVIRLLGIEPTLLAQGLQPDGFTSRDWRTGEILFKLPLARTAVARYGAPYLTIERGALHRALVGSVDPGTIRHGMALKEVRPDARAVSLHFENGDVETADIVIGADGLASRLREQLQGVERPSFSGQVAFRSMFPAAMLAIQPAHELTKWWEDGRFVIAYYLDAAKTNFYFVAGYPSAQWRYAATSRETDHAFMLDRFRGFHPEVMAILEASPSSREWPLFERRPQPAWHGERIVLIGDACHPMRPHMAQGAAMAIEDAAVLARCLAQAPVPDWKHAFRNYAQARLGRTSQVQAMSAVNDWLRHPTDPDWLFAHDATLAPGPAKRPEPLASDTWRLENAGS